MVLWSKLILFRRRTKCDKETIFSIKKDFRMNNLHNETIPQKLATSDDVEKSFRGEK